SCWGIRGPSLYSPNCIDISSFKHSCWGLRVPSLAVVRRTATTNGFLFQCEQQRQRRGDALIRIPADTRRLLAYCRRSKVTRTERGTSSTSTPESILPINDDAGRRNLLIVLAIVDGHVGARGPIGNVPDFVRMRPLAVGRDGSRQMAELFSAEEIVHRQRQRQQGNEVPCRFAVDQSCRGCFPVDRYTYLHRVCVQI